MVLHGHDSDAIQWGLRLFDGDSTFNSGYYGDIAQHDPNYQGDYYRSQYDPESTNVENDETIARNLQENFSQLSIIEASGFSNAGDEHLQPSIFSNDWQGSLSRNYSSDQDHVEEDLEVVEPSSSCSSPSVGEDYSYSYALDGDVDWRLNQITLIPHVPRINGEIPSIDEATSDHQRLLDRLQVYDFVEHKVQGDGNCQFRALSDQLYGTPDHHDLVRQKVLDQLKTHPKIYEEYVPMEYDDYLEKMSGSGEWGDHVTLQAAADMYGVKIFLLTSFKDTCCIEILPNFQKTKRVIFLSFWAEVHYNSIYPQGDMAPSTDAPSSELRKKRKWWFFRNKH